MSVAPYTPPPAGLMRYGAELGREIAPFDEWDNWVRVFPQVVQFAEYVQNTDFVPKDFKGRPDVITAVVLAGREMHLGPMASLQHLYPVNGRVGQSAQMMGAQARAVGHQILPVKMSDTEVVLKGRRRGEEEWVQVRFTATQAGSMGLSLDGSFMKNGKRAPGKYTPEDKLYARALSRLCRRLFQDAISSLPSIDEIEDEASREAIESGEAPPTSRTMRRRTAVRPAAVPLGLVGTGEPPRDAVSAPEAPATEGTAAGAPDSPDGAPAGTPAGTVAHQEPPQDAPDTTDEEADQSDEPEPPLPSQMRTLGRIFTQTLKMPDRKDAPEFQGKPVQNRHLVASAVAGRLVTSWADLNRTEAGDVITRIGNMPKDERDAAVRDLLTIGRTQLELAQAAEASDAEQSIEGEPMSEGEVAEALGAAPIIDAEEVQDAEEVEGETGND